MNSHQQKLDALGSQVSSGYVENTEKQPVRTGHSERLNAKLREGLPQF